MLPIKADDLGERRLKLAERRKVKNPRVPTNSIADAVAATEPFRFACDDNAKA